jgi:hypothetical protein
VSRRERGSWITLRCACPSPQDLVASWHPGTLSPVSLLRLRFNRIVLRFGPPRTALCASRFRLRLSFAHSMLAADSSCSAPSRTPRTSIHHPPSRTVGPRSSRRDLPQRQPLCPTRPVHGAAHSQGLLQPRTAPRGEGRERVGGHRGGSAQCWAAAGKGGRCEDRIGVERAG